MAPDEDHKLYQQVGFLTGSLRGIEDGITSIAKTVDKTSAKIDALDAKVTELNTNTVKQQDCQRRVNQITGEFVALRDAVQRACETAVRAEEEVTGVRHLSELQRRGKDENTGPIKAISTSVFARMKDRAAAIATVVGLLVLLSGLAWRGFDFLSKVHAVVEKSSAESRRQAAELKKEIDDLKNGGDPYMIPDPKLRYKN